MRHNTFNSEHFVNVSRLSRRGIQTQELFRFYRSEPSTQRDFRITRMTSSQQQWCNTCRSVRVSQAGPELWKDLAAEMSIGPILSYHYNPYLTFWVRSLFANTCSGRINRSRRMGACWIMQPGRRRYFSDVILVFWLDSSRNFHLPINWKK